MWDTRRDGIHAENVQFRMTPADATTVGLGVTRNFIVGNDDRDFFGTAPSLPTGRGRHTSAVVGGKMYVIGGAASGIAYADLLEIYDPVADTWSTGAPMPTGRRQLSCAVANGKIHAMGGYYVLASTGYFLDTERHIRY